MGHQVQFLSLTNGDAGHQSQGGGALGKQGVGGDGTDVFNKPSDMLVAPNGDIFVADGHDAGGNNRIIKFASDGTFIKQWGGDRLRGRPVP